LVRPKKHMHINVDTKTLAIQPQKEKRASCVTCISVTWYGFVKCITKPIS